MNKLKTVFKGQFYTVKHGYTKSAYGHRLKSEIITRADRVGVLASDKKGKVLLTREFRPRFDKIIWRFPIGKIDCKKTPLQIAKKELHEEIGYQAKQWRLLFKTNKANDLDYWMYYFVATDLQFIGATPHIHEKIMVKPTGILQAYRLAVKNEFCNATDSLAVVRLYDERKKWLK
jgi:8-oxo-dGTP pyrophosphatase MutT (NUDIX family)